MDILLNSFTAGELSPKLEGRVDIPNLSKGCRYLRNWIPRVTGGASRRPGTKYMWNTHYLASRDSWLIPFIYSNSDALVIEAGHQYFRFGSAGELVGSPYLLVTPWEEDEVQAVKHVQVNDVMYLAHPNYSPYRLTRLANDDWELESIQDIIAGQDPADGFAWPPMLDENISTVTITPNGTTGNIVLTASSALFENGHVGSFFQIAHRRDTAYSELLVPVIPPASATIDFRGVVPIAGQQHTIAGTAYTWKASADVTGPYMVAIGAGGTNLAADIDQSRVNLIAAINGTGGGPGTAQHPTVEATAVDLDTTTQAATAVLTGNGTNHLSAPESTPINVHVIIGAVNYGFMANPVDSLFHGATYNVKRGATERESLENLVKCINASGTNGNEYYGPSGVTAHTQVSAALTANNQVTITAKTPGTAGNAIAVSVNNSSLATEPLSWNGSTMTGGGASETYRIKVSARESGADGNSITVGGMYIGVLTSNNTLVANNDTVTLGSKTYRFRDVNNVLGGGAQAFTQANDVLIGATADATLLNLIDAINLTGTPGTSYENTTTINTDAFAAAAVTANHEVVVASKVVNPTSSIATTKTTATAADLSWGAATLQHPWNSTTLTGGSDIDTESDWFEVLGGYSLTSYGLWKGTIILERQRPDGSAEAVRQWRGNNDRNITETLNAEFTQKLRLRVVDGSGTVSADVDTPRFVIEAFDAKIYGLVKITSLISSLRANATVIKDLFSTDATYQWAEGAWSDYRGWPASVAIHDQRLVFMSTDYKPQSLWFSATGDFHNFRRGVNDADGFTRELAASESSPIIAGVSQGHGLVLFKESQEWLGAAADGQSAVTPTNFNARQQSAYGCENVAPVAVGPRILFVKSGGILLSDFQYQWDTQEFAAADLNELSDHLTRTGIRQIAYQRRPDSIVWVITATGELLSMHYRRDKEFIAWAKHTMDDAVVESICCIPGSNDRDDLYLIVTRTINGTERRYVERLDSATPFELDEDDIDDADQRALLCYLDCSKFQTGASSTSWSGLSHLEGALVAVQADGSYHEPVRVVSGAVTLTRAATSVLVGIDYSDESNLQPAAFDIQARDGTSRGKKWRVAELAIQFYRTSAARYADDETREFKDVKVVDSSAVAGEPVPVFTGIKTVACSAKYQDSVRTTIRPVSGEPCAVLAIIPGVVINS